MEAVYQLDVVIGVEQGLVIVLTVDIGKTAACFGKFAQSDRHKITTDQAAFCRTGQPEKTGFLSF